jgi:hypothetical protein
MVTGVLLALISATILRMSMLRYQMGGRGAKVLQEKRDDQAALAAVIATWNQNATPNAVCSGSPGAGWTVNVAGVPGTCNCQYTRNFVAGPPPTYSVIVNAIHCTGVNAPVTGCTANGICLVSIASTDIQ